MVKSSVFKKTCFECGAKVDFLVDSKCEECFKAENPPIVDVKPLNIKYCNSCKKLFYFNKFNDEKRLLKDINQLVSKNLVIDDHYVLNDVKVEGLEIDGAKVRFSVEVDCDLKK